jgi:hypothetical protein
MIRCARIRRTFFFEATALHLIITCTQYILCANLFPNVFRVEILVKAWMYVPVVVDFRRHKYLRSIRRRFRCLLIFRYYSTRVLTALVVVFVGDMNISRSISTDIHLQLIRLWYLNIRRDCRTLFSFTGWCLVTNNSIANSRPAFVLTISYGRFVFACVAVRVGKPMFRAIRVAYHGINGVSRHVGAIICLCVPFLL